MRSSSVPVLVAVLSLTIAACSTPPEKDPVYKGSSAAEVTAQDITHWNTAYSWGNHADAGYLKTEADPLFTASTAAGITSADVANWNAAFGWGNHADAGYLKTETDPVFAASPAAGITAQDISNWNAPETDPKVGSLSTSAVPRWGGSKLEDGSLTDTGTAVGVGTTAPSAALDVQALAVTSPALDQSQTSARGYATTSPAVAVWQTFTAGTSGYLTQIDLERASGATRFDVQVRVQGGAVLATYPCTLPYTWHLTACRLPTPVAITKGSVYRFTIVASAGVDIVVAAGNVYPGGSSNVGKGNDLTFQTWVGSAQPTSVLSVGSTVSVRTVLHLTPLATAPAAANAKAGDLYFDSTKKKLCYFNSAAWTCL